MRCFAGRLHYAVLWWAYIERGAFSRMPFDTFCEDLGWHFANAKQRKSWNEKRPSVRSGAPREYGKKLHAAAVKAFENNACAFV
jgi:hypothetical protein